MTDVRKATTADLDALATTLALGFQDDPGFSHAVPNTARRARLGPRYFAGILRHVYLPKDEVHTTADGAAVALWGPPDGWRAPASTTLRLAPLMLRACGTNVGTALRMVNQMETRHGQVEEPHFYLAFVATRPDQRGKGLGSALLRTVLDRADEEGLPAYLEATSVKNQALYHRHGFEPLEELHWPGGGPPWWPMYRRAR